MSWVPLAGVRRQTGLGLGFLLVVGVVFILCSPLVAASPFLDDRPVRVVAGKSGSGIGVIHVVRFGPPYLGATALSSNTTAVSGGASHPCAAQAKLVRPPSVNATTGAFDMDLLASAGFGPTCPHSFAAATVSGVVTMTSSNFTWSHHGGSYVFRPFWGMAWHIHLIALSPVPGNAGSSYIASDARLSVSVSVSLDDLTSGNHWGLSNGYTNASSLQNVNASMNQTLSTNISQPILIPMTSGDAYQFSATVSCSVTAVIGANTDQALAALNVGSAGGGLELEKVTFR